MTMEAFYLYAAALGLIVLAQIGVIRTRSFAANVALPAALLIALLLYLWL
jgi:hypothetical protein